jgi:hypothetical protein
VEWEDSWIVPWTTKSLLWGRAAAPKEISGQAEGEEDDGYFDVDELGGIFEGEIDGVGYYGRGG